MRKTSMRRPTAMKQTISRLVFAASLLSVAKPLHGENWPQWRGPNGDGTSPERGLPTEWSVTKNMAWKLDLPGPAGSTPVVRGDSIFLTSAEDQDLVVLGVSTAGKQLWKRKLGTGNRTVRGDEGNTAFPSPVTDGTLVWAFAGTGDLACYDFDGRGGLRPEHLEPRHPRPVLLLPEAQGGVEQGARQVRQLERGLELLDVARRPGPEAPLRREARVGSPRVRSPRFPSNPLPMVERP